MKRLALFCVVAACGGGASRPTAPSNTTASAAATPTVIFLAQGDQAVPLACANVGGAPIPERGCTALVTGDRAAMRGDGVATTLGGDVTWTCDAAGESAPALSMAAVQSSGTALESVLVWPKERAGDLRAWTRGAPASIDPAALQAAWARSFDPAEVEAEPLGTAQVVGVLTADVDGDGQDDAIYTVADDRGEEGQGRRAILAVLSTAPGDFALLAAANLEQLEAFAAIDLDRDGKDELVVAAPYYEGDGTSVYTLTGGALESIGGVWCGL